MERSATIRLTLVRSKDDEATFSPNYQRELKQFYQLVRADGTRMSAVSFTMAGVAEDRGLTESSSCGSRKKSEQPLRVPHMPGSKAELDAPCGWC